MKSICLLLLLFWQVSAAQKSEQFKGIDFDSSYTVIGMTQGYGHPGDSLERFWFVLDNPADMLALKREWIFKKQVPRIYVEDKSIDLNVIKDKRLTAGGTLIFPRQGIIKSGNAWYRFDTAELLRLHAAHPLHYHSQKRVFDTYAQYAAYGNSILHDSTLLFFFEPSLQYEGKFTLTAGRSDDPSSPLFVLRDITLELRELEPDVHFEAGLIQNDSFNIAHKDKVRIAVKGSKRLYEKYAVEGREKGDWQPSPIEITTFWRDH